MLHNTTRDNFHLKLLCARFLLAINQNVIIVLRIALKYCLRHIIFLKKCQQFVDFDNYFVELNLPGYKRSKYCKSLVIE